MIYIYKETTNSVLLTLSESTTIEDPYFIFKATNNTTQSEVIFSAEDTSPAPERYNLFSITEVPEDGSPTEDPYNGMIHLFPSGQWTVLIYESETLSLDPADWGSLLQTEIMVVSGDDTSINSIYQ